ncbi:MAG: TetR/AcrR family transcriptional regulator [Planctomycetes bacterium]|nr:TetR/AcrR family transcriptional regulator [Planctomycetota bacterium]
MDANDQRTAILKAANRVMRKNGLHGTTISAVAAEAGMTKGGVLYYFRNKQELLETVITRYEALAAARNMEIMATLPDEPGRVIRATVLTMLDLLETPSEDMHSGVGFLGDETYRKIIGAMRMRMFSELGKLVEDKSLLTTIIFIIDGIWAIKMFSFFDELPVRKEEIVRILMDMVDRSVGLTEDDDA